MDPLCLNLKQTKKNTIDLQMIQLQFSFKETIGNLKKKKLSKQRL